MNVDPSSLVFEGFKYWQIEIFKIYAGDKCQTVCHYSTFAVCMCRSERESEYVRGLHRTRHSQTFVIALGCCTNILNILQQLGLEGCCVFKRIVKIGNCINL